MAAKVELTNGGVFLLNGVEVVPEAEALARGIAKTPGEAALGTITHGILAAHNTSADPTRLRLRFDALTSPENNSVSILQSAKASGLERFPVPYVLSNCHNTLCAVGGTINDDDHAFVRSAAVRYGGIFVPPHVAVIHQYLRENLAAPGRLILGSDSHTRYGALGTMGIGEGGGEVVKQLLGDTYDIAYPKVVAVFLDGELRPGVGPHDAALVLVRALYVSGYAKNKVVEFVGPGVEGLPVDFRLGIGAMTAETTCLSSVWRTDEEVRAWLGIHGRADQYRKLSPASVAYYDGCCRIDLSSIRPMIALPFHPSNAYEIAEVIDNSDDILREVELRALSLARAAGNTTASELNLPLSLRDRLVRGRLKVSQGVIGGCTGGMFANVMNAARALKGRSCGDGDFSLDVYPASQAVNLELARNGAAFDLMAAGAVMRTAICGPCFGAGDTPRNGGLSIRHVTRNFAGREGAKFDRGQMAAVALMDARSIAATAANHGLLTAATELDVAWDERPAYHFDPEAYEHRVYQGFGKADPGESLVYGPNIKDWPELEPLAEDVLLKVCARLTEPVTTTDELVPSGEASAFRSNPTGLAEFTLKGVDPGYVGRAKTVATQEARRLAGEPLGDISGELNRVLDVLARVGQTVDARSCELGSILCAVKPGDGSSREQAASCQRVLGGLANLATDYATKRYRSNLINWGMLPLVFAGNSQPEAMALPEVGDYLYLPGIRSVLDGDVSGIVAYLVHGTAATRLVLSAGPLSGEERAIVKAGCLINNKRIRR